jgi:FkbM family methyltransferase
MTAIRTIRGTMPGLPGERDIAILDGDTHISRWVEESRRLDHDQNSLPAIGKLITPESVVYDVGAFIGDHTAFYASKAKVVFAFEAMADAFECLDRNLMHYTNVSLSSVAIGDGSEDVALVHGDANSGARRLIPCDWEDVDDIEPIVHGFWTIDRTAEDSRMPPTLIKLDIEGWEVRALRGAERTLREHHPIIVCEVNREALERAETSPEELHALLTGHGYEMHDLFTEEGWFPEDPRPQFDVVARWKR